MYHEEVVCPHCQSAQEEPMLTYRLASDRASGSNRSTVKCENSDCGEEFYVEYKDVTVYKSSFKRKMETPFE